MKVVNVPKPIFPEVTRYPPTAKTRETAASEIHSINAEMLLS